MKKKSYLKIVFVLLYLSIVGNLFINAQTFDYRSHTNSSIASYSMPYRLFVPSGYNSNNSYPIVLFLHGAGERGTDNNAQLNANRGATLWAETANQAAYPSFVVAPQCPPDKQWVNTNWSNGSYSITNVAMSTELQMVKNIIETLQTQYNIDASRIFITGLSMGGYGTWDFILRYPTMFKAAIPICGAGDPSKASLIGTLPLRVFHSSDDGTVPVSGSRNMVNAINALGSNNRNPFYTEYTDQGHFSWVNAYNTSGLVSWMFTTPPITITTSLRNPENPANAVNGLDYKYYQGTWSVLPDFSSLTPVASGTVTNFDLTPKLQSDNFGFQYTGYINVANDGTYIFYTSSDDGSKLYIGSTLVVNNDGLHGSAEVGSPIALKAGTHAIRVDFFEGPGDEVLEVHYEGPNLTKQLIPAAALYRVASSSQSPYGGTARAIPGTIQAEDFDNGGQGVAYNDSGTANEGGQYRTTEGVDIEVCAEGGYDIGWVNAGEWMEYTVNAVAGTYNINLRVSSPNSSKQAKVYLDGTLLGTFTVPNTGSWQTWQTVTVNNVVVSGGNGKILKIECVTDGFNINSVQFTSASSIAVTSVSVSPTTASLSVSATQQLTATVLPANATNKTVSWSSSNTSVATVTSSGLVTGIAAGSSTITVTTQDGARTATCAVSVTASTGNLALNKTATASSSEGSGFEASKAVDGSTSTRWASGMNDPNPEWVYVDLGSSYSISRVKLTWEAAYGRSYQIQVSPDASTWTTIYTTTTGDGGVDDLTSLSGTGRYVRMYATQRGLGGGFSLYEFEVYGTTGTIPVTYEAEDATMGGTVHFNNGDGGFSGTGFAQGFGSNGDYVQFSIIGATAGNQDVTLRYTTGSPGTLHLYVNGTMIRQVAIITTGGWSNWRDHVDNVTLNAGNNTIKYQRDAGDTAGMYSIDYLSFGNGLQSVKKQFEVSNDAFENDLNVKVYPNPLTEGILVVELLKEGTSEVTMYSITGKEVFNTTVTNADKLYLPREQLNEGMYILNVRSGNEVNNVKVIVK